MATFSFELPWPPTGNTATRHTRSGSHYTTAKVLSYRALVLRTLASVGLGSLTSKKPLLGPLSVSWVLAPPDATKSRDIDNHRKVLADALTLAGLWTDDSNKVIRKETFEWTDPEAGGKVFISISQC